MLRAYGVAAAAAGHDAGVYHMFHVFVTIWDVFVTIRDVFVTITRM